MPLLFTLFGFKFFFYSNEHSPIHIHVKKGNARAKFLLFPVKVLENKGMKPTEIKAAELIIKQRVEFISEKWNCYFNQER